MLSRLRSLFRRAAPAPPTVEVTAAGFALRGGVGPAVAVDWAQVRRVVAFKRDLYATDCIVLVVEHGTPPALVELSEEWPGFAELFGAMEAALGVSPSWYLEIMTPAFEPTPRVLFERPGG